MWIVENINDALVKIICVFVSIEASSVNKLYGELDGRKFAQT